MSDTVTFNGVVYNARHGGPFDRGSADSYYRRGVHPHYYKGATGTTGRVEKADMSPAAIEAYMAGYDYNEFMGYFKEW